MKNIILFIGAVFFMLEIISCNHYEQTIETVTFQLPPYPASEYGVTFPPLSRWQIKIQSASSTQEFFTNSSSFTLELQKNLPVSISAYPITLLENGSEALFFYPAGTIYPYNFDSSSCSQNLTWEHGYCANILNILFQSKNESSASPTDQDNFISSFNWKKFMEAVTQNQTTATASILQNSTQKTYNPWQINTEVLLSRLSQGNFSSSLLETKNLFTVKNKNLCNNLLSPYIPENQIIQNHSFLTLSKTVTQMYMENNTYGLLLNGTSAKNLSLQRIYMPIFKEYYEKN